MIFLYIFIIFNLLSFSMPLNLTPLYLNKSTFKILNEIFHYLKVDRSKLLSYSDIENI